MRAIRKRYFARSLGRIRDQLSAYVARGFHRPVDIRLAGLGDLGEGRFTRGIDRRVPLVREGLHELTADEEPVAVLEMNDLTGFGRGRVLPGRWDRGGVGPSRDLAFAFSQR